MLSKIRNNKKIISNFSYLFFIEMANYILPFITIPYIVQTVGVKNFGIITFTYVVMTYFQMIINYGFKMLAIKDISLHRHSQDEISRFFWKTMFSQFILLILSVIIFVILLFSVSQLYEYKEVYIFAFGMVLGNFLFPIWFFLGLEEMKYVAILNFISRVAYTIAIFLVIQDNTDFIYIPLLNSLSMLFIGLISLVIIKIQFNIIFIPPTIDKVRQFFIEGYHLFLSAITVNLYSTFNTILLGFLAGYEAVGTYSLAERIFAALKKVIGIVNTVLYPYLAKFLDYKEILITKMKYILRYYILALFIMSIILYFTADFSITLLFGEGHSISILILKIFAFILFFQPFGGFFTSYLILKSEQKIVSKITFQTMLLNFIIVFPLIYFYQAIGLVITILLISMFQVYLNTKYNKELLI